LFIPVWHKSGEGIVSKPWLTREITDRIRFKEEANWSEKTIGLRIGSNLKFSKGGPRDSQNHRIY